MGADQIDQAIARAAAIDSEPIQINVGLASTGRAVAVIVPADLTDDELLEMIAWMVRPAAETGMRTHLPGRRKIKATLIVPTPGGLPT